VTDYKSIVTVDLMKNMQSVLAALEKKLSSLEEKEK
jgi:hypothetical protein